MTFYFHLSPPKAKGASGAWREISGTHDLQSLSREPIGALAHGEANVNELRQTLMPIANFV
jgi:hypothetical protein